MTMLLKRAFYSMRYRKGQNIALTIAYTLLFALILGILLVYLSMSADLLQKSLGCAVTLRSSVWDLSLGAASPILTNLRLIAIIKTERQVNGMKTRMIRFGEARHSLSAA